MNILNKLNSQYQIEVKNNIAYDKQEKNILARSKQELVQFYIDSFEYKKESLFNNENKTRKRYNNIIKKLKKIS